MVKFMEKKDIIMLKEQSLSNREVSRRTGADRETVAKYWNEYRRNLQELEKPGTDIKSIQESLLSKPEYNAKNRKRHKYTEEVDKRLKAILKEEARKDRLFGSGHKQKLILCVSKSNSVYQNGCSASIFSCKSLLTVAGFSTILTGWFFA